MALEELQNGRYHRLRLLGSGGMGEVYLMEDRRISRQVAIKVIRSEGASYPNSDAARDAARLFQREAKAIAALEHPNILPLYDFGEETLDGTTITYMVMPFCAEGSVATWLRQRESATALSAQDIAYLVGQTSEALQYAHDHQVIHLDVKPSNFLLRNNRKNPNRPTLLLADFGIARNSATAASSSRTIRGTPTSMAPEQWSGKPVPATDQYALAVMAYELLAGRPPFMGSMEQLMYQHFTAQPPPPSTFNTHLPAAIDSVLLRALAKKPEDRFPSIAAFANAFEEALLLTIAIKRPEEARPPSDAMRAEAMPRISQPGMEQPLDPISSHDLPTILASTPNLQAPERLQEPPLPKRRSAPRSRSIGIISGLIILLLLVGTGYYFISQQSSSRQADTIAHSKTATALAQARQTPTRTLTGTPSTTPQNGLYIAGTYNGSMFDQTTQQTSYITVFIVQTRGDATLSGKFTFTSPSQGEYPLNGTVDPQGNFSFTVQSSASQAPLYFYGTLQQDVYLKGNFCTSSTNSCSVNTGYFTVGPRY